MKIADCMLERERERESDFCTIALRGRGTSRNRRIAKRQIKNKQKQSKQLLAIDRIVRERGENESVFFDWFNIHTGYSHITSHFFMKVVGSGSRYTERRSSRSEPRDHEDDREWDRGEGDRGEGDRCEDRRGAGVLPARGVQGQPPILHP